MRHLTAQIIKESHYLPNNNVRICWMIDKEVGIAGEEAKIRRRAECLIREGWCPVCVNSYADWYADALQKVMEALKCPHTVPEKAYQPFNCPCPECK